MDTPKLDKPGAGLPFPDKYVVRWWIGPFVSRRADKDRNLRLFATAGKRVLKEFAEIPASQRDSKVLVPKLRGVEDSSRFWCANEVLEHLMITGVPIRGLIETLAKGGTSDYEVKIENFKPKGRYAGRDASVDFKAFLAETAAALDPLDIRDAGPTHRHPWMGPFNALQWTWVLAGHTGIHLAQLQAIKKGL
jgi:hypothetical protein